MSGGTQMTEHKKADQARKGLIASVKGRAKEIFGAVTKNDSLTAEGQLEQTEAEVRKEASSVEAVADAETAQAKADATAARREGVEERIAVNAETAAEKNSIQAEKAAHKRAAEQAHIGISPKSRLRPSSIPSTRQSTPRP